MKHPDTNCDCGQAAARWHCGGVVLAVARLQSWRCRPLPQSV